MRQVRAFLTGVAAGTGLMYWFDPDRGTRRRALARDKLLHIVRAEREVAAKGLRDLEHRRQGALYRLGSVFRDDEASDDVLAERVRATLGRYTSHPGAIDVAVRQGSAILDGPILAREAGRLLRAVHGVPGIHAIDDRLERHEHPGNVPGLQGPGHAVPRRRKLVRSANWMPSVRLLLGGAGLAAGIGGLLSGGKLGRAGALLGSLAFVRAAANMPLARLVGVGERVGIELDKTLLVKAPAASCYSYFRNFENLASFMEHVHEVRVHDGRSSWVVRGPAGRSLRFDVEITRDAPNELIAWRTVPGQLVDFAGTVRFERVDDGSTRLALHVSYRPPLGRLGYLVASMFRADPKHALDSDMLRFKSILERGKTRAHGHEVRREELRPA